MPRADFAILGAAWYRTALSAVVALEPGLIAVLGILSLGVTVVSFSRIRRSRSRSCRPVPACLAISRTCRCTNCLVSELELAQRGTYRLDSRVNDLLGMNVGGLPATNSPWGFAIVMALMALIALAELLYFKRRGWFR
jgi:hypothetical protein